MWRQSILASKTKLGITKINIIEAIYQSNSIPSYQLALKNIKTKLRNSKIQFFYWEKLEVWKVKEQIPDNVNKNYNWM